MPSDLIREFQQVEEKESQRKDARLECAGTKPHLIAELREGELAGVPESPWNVNRSTKDMQSICLRS